MPATKHAQFLLIGAAALLTAACGGGGSEVASMPAPITTPTPTPTPTPTSSAPPVKIFSNPTVGQYGSTGVRANVGEWAIAAPSTPDANAVLKPSTDPAGQVKVAYQANGTYTVDLLGWLQILQQPQGSTDPNNPAFHATSNGGKFTISLSRDKGYQYSELANWWTPDNDWAFTAEFGTVAFGSLTPAGGAPVSGTASYTGYISGITDAKEAIDSKSYLLIPADGSINLQFDFGKSTLSGEMILLLQGGMNPVEVGRYQLTNGMLQNGNLAYSGKFDTALAGSNFFNGQFTGPNAQETIGAWAVPFTLSGKTQQAMGAWIAKR
jgi:hypothetical protein